MTTPPPTSADADLLAALSASGIALGAPAAGGRKVPQVYWKISPPPMVEPPRPLDANGRPLAGPLPLFPAEQPRPLDAGGRPLAGPMPLQKNTAESMDSDLARVDILKWSEQERDALAQRLVEAGALPPEHTLLDLRQAWEQMVDYAEDYHTAGIELTPWDMIGIYGSGGNSAKQTIQRQARVSDPDEARRVLTSAMGSALGRKPTEAELDDFQASLNEAQRAAPVVTTTSSKTDFSGNTVIDSVSEGGIDVSGYTDEYAESGDNEKEYGAYQAATTYTNAFLDAIRSPV